ncbi:MAG: 50S ribosomal protein L11 methyltransferase [Myxococcota bacterium]|nr:50S ribosomal protein L11 methyltransferase [Myxococcota bacterium]
MTLSVDDHAVESCAWLLAEALDQPIEVCDPDTLTARDTETAIIIARDKAPDQALLATIRDVLDRLNQGHVAIEVQVTQNRAWVDEWKAFFHAQVISPRFAVHPPWEAPLAHPVNISIEPGMAFGTGTHPTTAGCLRMLDDALIDAAPSSILDVGCGSGILAIAAAHLGHQVVAIDHDIDALENAQVNAENNQVAHLIDFQHRSPASISGTFDLVVANIIAPVLIELAPAIITRCRRRLILSGLLAKQETAVLEAYAALKCVDRSTWDDWVFLSMVRP